MPELDPVYYEAIDEIIEERHTNAEWEPDEMRSALIDVAGGEKQNDAVEDRGFSQPVLSEKWNEVKERTKEIRQRRQRSSGMFRDPIEEAKDGFEEFFEEMNQKYDMGINSMTVQMMLDEIDDSGEVPAPMFVASFLRDTKSGVSQGAEIDYIVRRYRNWLDQYLGGDEDYAPGNGMGDPGGMTISGQRGPDPQGSPGVSVGGHGPDKQQNGHQSQGDDRIDRLEQQVANLAEAVAQDQQQQQQPQGQVTVEMDNGQKAQLPMDHPMAMQMMMQNMGGGSSDGNDMLDQLQKAKNAGLVLGPEHLDDDDGGDEVAQAVMQSIEKLGQQQAQAQKEMSQNFSNAIESLRDMQEEDEDLTAEDVKDIVEESMTKSEVEQVREEMDDKFDRVMEEVQGRRRSRGEKPNDPEFLKHDREMDFREKQLETVNQNIQQIPKAVASSVREGLVPAMKEMRHMGGGSGNPMWSPPGEGQRGQPSFQPSQPGGSPPGAPDPGDQPTPGTQDGGSPDPSGTPADSPGGGGGPAAERQPDSVDHRDVEEIRSKLNIGGSDSSDEVEA